ncbi:hypothetical protein [Dyella psychrodurans]|uniref:Ankyrin repeat domain-containing protein n=1 Tax=Dyella psychrodurans TaxID=1927960 RepID=A0A370XBR8_9GAMM|nr:hypothetical protein [Dyella psychrodurans]RDS85848.1 hypothetical protein DWU99_00815 [Dyella psychrodurans]
MPRFLVSTTVALALGFVATMAVAGATPNPQSTVIAQDLRAAANDMVDVAAAADAHRLQADIADAQRHGADPLATAGAPLLMDLLGDIGDAWSQRNHGGDWEYSANADPSSHQVDAVKLLLADGANACAPTTLAAPRNYDQVPMAERLEIARLLSAAAPNGCHGGRAR